MKVIELIAKLSGMDPEAEVYRPLNGNQGEEWTKIYCVEQACGSWDKDNNCPIYEVVIE